jgi:hypothetical protein
MTNGKRSAALANEEEDTTQINAIIKRKRFMALENNGGEERGSGVSFPVGGWVSAILKTFSPTGKKTPDPLMVSTP